MPLDKLPQQKAEIPFVEYVSDPRPESLSEEELQQVKQRFSNIQKLLNALVRPGTGIAREYPLPDDGKVSIIEYCFAIEYLDQSYIWVSYGGMICDDAPSDPLTQPLMRKAIYLELHGADDVVTQRHGYFIHDDGPVQRVSEMDPARTKKRMCMTDQIKTIAFHENFPDVNPEFVAGINEGVAALRLEEYLGYNNQPVSLAEIKGVHALLRDAVAYAPEPEVA